MSINEIMISKWLLFIDEALLQPSSLQDVIIPDTIFNGCSFNLSVKLECDPSESSSLVKVQVLITICLPLLAIVIIRVINDKISYK